MQESMPFPYNNIIDGPPFERLVAISIACTAHLFFAGVTSVSLCVVYTYLSLLKSIPVL